MRTIRSGGEVAAPRSAKKRAAPETISIWRHRLVQADLEIRQRHKGSEAGGVGRIGLDLWKLISWYARKGRVAQLSYKELAKKLNCCVSAVQEAVQRLARWDALNVIAQYGWNTSKTKWVRQANVYEIRPPRCDAASMPLFKRVRGVCKAAKELLANVQQSFWGRPDVAGTQARAAKDIKTAEATASPPIARPPGDRIAAICDRARERKTERLRREESVSGIAEFA